MSCGLKPDVKPGQSTKLQIMADTGHVYKLQLDVVDRSHDEMSELANNVPELSQTLRQ